MKLSDRIKKARKTKGLTQADLAMEIPIALASLNMYEKGKRTPDAETLAKIALITGCNPGWLLTGGGDYSNIGPKENMASMNSAGECQRRLIELEEKFNAIVREHHEFKKKISGAVDSIAAQIRTKKG